MLDNRSFGGAQVSRTFYARGQTGQQLLLGAYQALERQIGDGQVKCSRAPRCSTWWWSTGSARGIVTRNLITGKVESHVADAVVLGTGGYGNVITFRPTPRAATPPPSGGRTRSGALFANPCFTQIHPTCIPVTRRLSIQADADERIAAQRRARVGAARRRATSAAQPDPRRRARLLPGAPLSQLRQPGAARRGLAQRQGWCATKGAAWASPGWACTWIFATRSSAWARQVIAERYGNLFDMYERITGENPYQVPMRIYPGDPLHHGRAVGGLQPDEHHSGPVRDRRGEFLRSRRQPAGRQRAHAGPGGRLFRPAQHHRRLLATAKLEKVDTGHPAFKRGGNSRSPA